MRRALFAIGAIVLIGTRLGSAVREFIVHDDASKPVVLTPSPGPATDSCTDRIVSIDPDGTVTILICDEIDS